MIYPFQNSNLQQDFLNHHTQLEEERGLDDDDSTRYYLTNSLSDNLGEMNIKVINIQNEPEKIDSIVHEKRFVFLKSNENNLEVHADPIWEKKLRKVEKLNIEDPTGQVKVINNTGNVIFKAFTHAEMREIAKIHRVALQILKEKKKESIKEEPSVHHKTLFTCFL